VGFLDEIEAYRQPNGLFSNQINPTNDSTGNGIAITSLAAYVAFQNGGNSLDFRSGLMNAIVPCQVPNLSGLLNRSPTKIGDQEGWDDYVMLLSIVSSWKLPIGQRILDYGKANLFFFNNVTPGKKSLELFLGRYPQFIAHCYFGNGSMPNPFSWLAWMIGIFFSAFSNDDTDIVLNYMMIQSAPDSLVSKFWRKMNHPDRVKSAVLAWLSNPDHPIVKYWKG
jgi:hypothetical protein